VASVVRPALDRGAVVITDRYVDSSIAYQGIARGLGAETIAELSRFATEGLLPDLTILLDVPPSVGRRRNQGTADRLETEADNFHVSVRAAYLARATTQPERYVVVDATLPAEHVDAAILDGVKKLGLL
jgi:dTMP kinase